MEAKIYNQQGVEAGTITLPEDIFATNWSSDTVHQVVNAMLANKRQPIAHTKDRSDVRGGGKKPWKQKGTGQARHGSRRSPIWRGGGITFGPRNEKDYSQKINKKMRDKALLAVLSKKWKDGEILLVDNISFPAPKTADAKVVLSNLSKVSGFEKMAGKRKNAFYMAVETKEKNVVKSFSNFGNGTVDEIRNINPVNLLTYKYFILVNPQSAISFLSSKSRKAVSEEGKVQEVKAKVAKAKVTKSKK